MEKTKRNWLITGLLAFVMLFGCMLGLGINNTVQVAYATGPENVAASELQIVLHRNDHSTDSTTFAGGKYLHINPAYETLETNSSSAGADMEYDASTGVLKLYDTDNMSTYEGELSLYGLNSSDKQLTIEDYYNGFDFYNLAFEKGNLTLENVSNSETHFSMWWGNKFKINGELTIRGNTSVHPYLAATGYNYDVNNIIEAGTLKLLGNSSLTYTANSSDDIYSIVYVNSLVLNTDGELYLDAKEATLKNNGKVLYASDVTLTKVKEITLVSPDNYDTTLTNSTYLRNAPTSPIPDYYSVIIQEDYYGDYIKTYYLISNSTYFTVSFWKNGGTGTMTPVQNVNGTFVLPECTFVPPTGYGDLEFQYWADKSYGGNTYAEGDSYTLVENITFYARWKTATNHNVSFDANNGTGSMAGGSYLGAYTLPECTITAPSGKQFKCWALGSADSTTQFDAGDTYYLHKDVTFYPVWEDSSEPTEYMVVYVTNGAEGSNDMDYAEDGSQITLATPESLNFIPLAHHHFVGWAVGALNATPLKQPGEKVTITAETYIYAIWEEDTKYTVTYHANGGTGVDYPENDVYAGTYELANISQTGFTAPSGKQFKGWSNTNNGDIINTPNISIDGNKDLYAIWEDIPAVQYTVTFNSNGGSGTMANVLYAGTYTLPENPFTAPEGKEFDGWAYTSNGTKISTAQIQITADTELFAIWKNIEVGPEPEPEPQPEPEVPAAEPAGLGAGAIAGIVIASVCVASIGAFALVWFVLKKKTWADFVALFKKK